ncbi:transposase [Methanotorris formicicus Mc-S-70]|uniref:Transposase n=5 Tax=Methanotorris formicicus TaxID=213185 RepID=H1KZY1_9EURY|nr:transposase [Methanotorris formicicus Mc-S-70]
MLISINPANQHDLDILKENFRGFVREFMNCSIIGDKGYIDKGFENLLRQGKVYFEAIKEIRQTLRVCYSLATASENMIKSFIERTKYKILNKLRKSIETNFSKLVAMFSKHIHAVSKKGLSVKLLLFTIAYNLKVLDEVNSIK